MPARNSYRLRPQPDESSQNKRSKTIPNLSSRQCKKQSKESKLRIKDKKPLLSSFRTEKTNRKFDRIGQVMVPAGSEKKSFLRTFRPGSSKEHFEDLGPAIAPMQ